MKSIEDEKKQKRQQTYIHTRKKIVIKMKNKNRKMQRNNIRTTTRFGH